MGSYLHKNIDRTRIGHEVSTVEADLRVQSNNIMLSQCSNDVVNEKMSYN